LEISFLPFQKTLKKKSYSQRVSGQVSRFFIQSHSKLCINSQNGKRKKIEKFFEPQDLSMKSFRKPSREEFFFFRKFRFEWKQGTTIFQTLRLLIAHPKFLIYWFNPSFLSISTYFLKKRRNHLKIFCIS